MYGAVRQQRLALRAQESSAPPPLPPREAQEDDEKRLEALEAAARARKGMKAEQAEAMRAVARPARVRSGAAVCWLTSSAGRPHVLLYTPLCSPFNQTRASLPALVWNECAPSQVMLCCGCLLKVLLMASGIAALCQCYPGCYPAGLFFLWGHGRVEGGEAVPRG